MASPIQRSKQRPAPSSRPAQLERLLDRKGQLRFERIGAPRATMGDLYHSLLTARYTTVAFVFFVTYVAANALFAGLYLLDDGAIAGAEEGSFRDAFFFSVQTMTTIGYGGMTPQGVYANALVTLEAFFGLLGLSLATGLLFAKFSRPTSRVLFSDRIVIDHWEDGLKALKIRLANGRANQIAEARISLNLIWDITLDDGSRFRRLVELPVVRNHTPLFALTWTVIHAIDDHSPLKGLTRSDLQARNAEILLALNGIDETFAQGVQARHAWTPDEVEWDARYRDIIEVTDDGRRQLNYALLDSVDHHDTHSTPELTAMAAGSVHADDAVPQADRSEHQRSVPR